MVSEPSSVLQTLLARLEASAQPAQPARPRAAEPGPSPDTAASRAAPKVAIPDGAVSLDPNARRGTYLNVVV